MKKNLQSLTWVGAGWLASISTAMAAPMGSEITYQGVLEDAGLSVTGQVDMIFTLKDAVTMGNVVGAAVVFDGQVGNGQPVDVTDGLFTVAPNFGANVFDGTALWLEIQVRSPHDPTNTALYTTLDPRQPITAAPIALQTRGIFVDENTGDVGIGLTTPQFPLQVHLGPGTGTVPANGTAIHGNSASGYGVVGFSKGAARAGIWGENNATSGEARGVWGRSTFSTGIGVYAEGFSFAGANHALHAKTNSPDGYAGYFEGGKNYFEGNVGIGTPTPAASLDVAQGDIVATDAGVIQVQISGVGPGGQLSIRNDDGTETLEILGGAASAGATFSMFDVGTAFETVGIDGDTTRGGRITTSSEDGITQSTIEPDVSTGGGLFVNWRRSDSSTGLTFDGNSGNSGNPRLILSSGLSPMTFDTNAVGSASVVLPADAIDASEILDEPGVASTSTNSGLSLTGAVDTILSRTITVPASGFVLAIGTCQANAFHVTGTTSIANFGVSDTAGAIPLTQDVAWTVPSAYPSGTVNQPVTVQTIFSVSSGASTFYFLGDENGGIISCNDMTLSLIYVPTSYGTVVVPLTGPGPEDHLAPDVAPLSVADIEAERLEAAAFHQQRIGRELQQMQSQMQALQAQLDQVMREQGLDQSLPRSPRRESTISPRSSEKNAETSKLSTEKDAKIELPRDKAAELETRSARIQAVPSSQVNGGTR